MNSKENVIVLLRTDMDACLARARRNNAMANECLSMMRLDEADYWIQKGQKEIDDFNELLKMYELLTNK